MSSTDGHEFPHSKSKLKNTKKGGSSIKDLFHVIVSDDKTIEKEFNEPINEEDTKLPDDSSAEDEEEEYPYCNTEGNEEEFEDHKRKNSFIQRMFSKVEAGSIRAAIFNLTALALGVGCQSLPQTFSRMSFLAGFIMFNFCGFCAWWSYNLMHIASKNAKENEFSKLVSKVLNKKLGLILNILILLYSMGMFITYQINSKITFYF